MKTKPTADHLVKQAERLEQVLASLQNLALRAADCLDGTGSAGDRARKAWLNDLVRVAGDGDRDGPVQRTVNQLYDSAWGGYGNWAQPKAAKGSAQ